MIYDAECRRRRARQVRQFVVHGHPPTRNSVNHAGRQYIRSQARHAKPVRQLPQTIRSPARTNAIIAANIPWIRTRVGAVRASRAGSSHPALGGQRGPLVPAPPGRRRCATSSTPHHRGQESRVMDEGRHGREDEERPNRIAVTIASEPDTCPATEYGTSRGRLHDLLLSPGADGPCRVRQRPLRVTWRRDMSRRSGRPER